MRKGLPPLTAWLCALAPFCPRTPAPSTTARLNASFMKSTSLLKLAAAFLKIQNKTIMTKTLHLKNTTYIKPRELSLSLFAHKEGGGLNANQITSTQGGPPSLAARGFLPTCKWGTKGHVWAGGRWGLWASVTFFKEFPLVPSNDDEQ